MISFRLTAEEYNRFHELCASCGTRSVSELARTAINALLKQPPQVPRETLEYQVATLEGRVNMLLLEFKRMRERNGGRAFERHLEKISERAES